MPFLFLWKVTLAWYAFLLVDIAQIFCFFIGGSPQIVCAIVRGLAKIVLICTRGEGVKKPDFYPFVLFGCSLINFVVKLTLILAYV